MTQDPWAAANDAAVAATTVAYVEPVVPETMEEIGIVQITERTFRNGDVFYVRSARQRGKFYEVRNGHCTCDGYHYRRTCNHLAHLEKEGLLVPDVRNGIGHQPGSGQNHVEQAAKVTSGVRTSLAGATTEVLQRDGQIRRLQAFAQAQRRVIVEQRRLIEALRTDSAQTRRAMKMVAVVTGELDQAAAGLATGDLVELQD